MKRALSVLLITIMMITLITVTPLTAGAAETDYEYTVKDDGTAEITAYYGSETNLSIPSSLGGYTVTGIGEFAFYGNDDLISVVIPDSVTTIEPNSFGYCPSLKSVTFGKGVTEIGEWSFSDCFALESVTIGNHITHIGDWSFYGCGALKSVTIGDSVTDIGHCAFMSCNSLSDVKLGKSIKNIGSSAFFGCTALKSITIPDSGAALGYYSVGFFEDPELVDYIPVDGFTIYGYTDSEAQQYARINSISFVSLGQTTAPPRLSYSVKDDGTAEITGFSGAATDYVIPSKIDGYTVTSIGEYAFAYHSSLTSITIPDTVKKIDYYAFNDCASLSAVTLGDAGMDIMYRAFFDCPSLKSVTIPDSGIKIYNEAFGFLKGESEWAESIPVDGFTIYGYSGSDSQKYAESNDFAFVSLGETTVPCRLIYYVEEDGGALITDCAGMPKKLDIPAEIDGHTVTAISFDAFYGDDSITEVSIPSTVISINGSVFAGCPSLAKITVDEKNPVYDSRDNCNAIIETETNALIQGCKDTVIPNSVTKIADSAFFMCTSLESIVIPASVKEIGFFAFAGCTGLTRVTLPDTNVKIDSAFYDCTSLKSITIPASITQIEKYAFGYYNEENPIMPDLFSLKCAAKMDGFTVYGKAGSKAEEYAEKNGFAFSTSDEPAVTVTRGDYDGDNDITIMDATRVQNIIAELVAKPDDAFLKSADADGDQELTIMDATRIQNVLAELMNIDGDPV